MLQALLTALGLLPKVFGTIDNITNAIASERLAVIKAKTDEDRIGAEERAKALEARRDVLVQEAATPASSKMNALMRFLLALGPTAVLLKLLAWDKVVGSLVGCAGPNGKLIGCEWFNTDPLDSNQWWVIGAAVSFYFLTTWKPTK